MNGPDGETKKRILVVEDESVIRALVRRVLAGGDWELVVADSIQEGQSWIHGQAFDLLLTDLRLPDGHGVEIMRLFKAKFPHAAMIVMTGSLTPEDRFHEVPLLGEVECIFKPFDLDVLQKAVSQALGAVCQTFE